MSLFLFSCDTEDYTGYSTLVPTSPTITVSGVPSSINFIEQDSTFTFTLTMSPAQIMNVTVYVTQSAGTATEGDDFEILNDGGKAIFAAGATTAEVKIKILADDVAEETETFTIKIGDDRTANATLTPVSVDFTIQNYTAGDLAIDMSWAAVAFDQYGEELTATEIADMILQVYNAAGTLIGEADGGSFEHLVLAGSRPDGTYHVRAAFYAAEQFNEPVDIDFVVDFAQAGVFEDSYDFPALATTATSELCEIQINLVDIVKSGTNYTFTEVGSQEFSFVLGDFVGTYDGLDGSYTDGADGRYSNPVELVLDGDDITLDGLNYGWMEDFWGETVTASTPVVVTFNTDGTLTIASQPYITTLYDGSPYDYSIVGSGTYNLCNPVSLHIEYDMYNTTDDYSIGEWMYDNGYNDTEYFIADIELGAKGSSILPVKNVKIQKPNR